ncbi:ATP-binding protein [Actinomadura sp. 7K507]|uniref:AlbA family DNA-binding domain-containing protein n=1 Tax=Actinomadura sp. 7K507 TaxID=2530365 RepID=UPI00105338A6|nr:ATP-binding protein [Actinomadura sp. 7K507]TDC89581.1 ATP-binding protein [Actinomadura sp. 7K507]
MLRSPRLEALFGKRLEQVTFADVQGLVGREEAAEASDLDYKELVHAKNPEQKAEFCKDVVAMANDRGGALIVGVREDGDQAIPEAITKVDVTDGERQRLYAVLTNTAPHPLPVDIVPVNDPDDPGRGVLLVLVERSALAPHTVLDTREKVHHRDGWLRYPIRNGAATRWMQEPEIATRYRDRFTHGRSVQDRVSEVEIECLLAYEERDQWDGGDDGSASQASSPLAPRVPYIPYFEENREPARPILAVTVAPEVAGLLVINRASLMEFQRSIGTTSVLVGRDVTFENVRVAPGRLVASFGAPIIALYAEFHEDGSGTFLVTLLPPKSDDTVELLAQDAMFYVLSGLRCLGRHARDRTGATGVAAIRCSILGGINEFGGVETALPHRGDPYEIKLISEGNHGEYANLRSTTRAVGNAFAHVDDLAVDGPGLISAAAMVSNEACHAFGLPQVPLLDINGTINFHHWGPSMKPTIAAWARTFGAAT